MVRIPGFHPGDPGSSPGVGIFKHIFPSGQRGQTQDLMQYASWVRIPLCAWYRVRVVKEIDLKSIGLCPRRFESCRYRWFCGVMVSTLDFESNDPGSNPGKTFFI